MNLNSHVYLMHMLSVPEAILVFPLLSSPYGVECMKQMDNIVFNACVCLIQKKRSHSVHKASSRVTTDSVSTTIWYATRCQIALMTVTNHFTVMLTSALKWRFTSVDISAWILLQASIVNATRATSKWMLL
jgi:hypothetical protein